MAESGVHFSRIIFLIGVTIVSFILIKAGLERIRVTPIVGYLALGFLIRLADVQWGILSRGMVEIFEFLARVGIICLLFRVGLESDLSGLIRQLRAAGLLGLGDILLSSAFAFTGAYFLLGISLVPSLFITTALTATSVGVPLGVWHEVNAIDSSNGELLLDVAEIDDIVGVILLALLLAVAPVLTTGTWGELFPLVARTIGRFLAQALVFGAFCLLFSRYVEQHITKFFRGLKHGPDLMLMITGVGFVIAALAALMGFSAAIGAFFAGLVFSRDPEAVRTETSFEPLYEFFTPFFFIGVGLYLDPQSLGMSLGIGAILLVAAILGKFIGVGGPALALNGRTGALLIGISMIPRAEITMIVMQRGSALGEWAVPSHVFAAVILISAVTCLATPLILRPLLRKWPQRADAGSRV